MARQQAPTKRQLSVFGFPTHIRPGFGAFMVLLVLIYPFPLGVWVAGAVGLFTLVHELGHAFAARAASCKASISLDFMVAYAAYEPTRTLTWRQRAAIAVSGPALQTSLGFLILLLAGVNPFSRDDIGQSNFSAAVWWAGIALGLLNLIPVMPLDGGAIVSTVAEHLFPGRGKNAVLKASFGITIALGAVMLIVGQMGFLPLIGLLLIMQYQTLTEKQRLKSVLQYSQEEATDDPSVNALVLDLTIANNLPEEGVAFAKNAFAQTPSFSIAFAGATSALMMGDSANAIQWLRAAEAAQIHPHELAHAISQSGFFDLLQNRPEVSREWFAQS